MATIEARLEQIAAAIQRRKLEREEPIDALSQSLFWFGAFMRDTPAAALLEELTAMLDEDGRQILTPEAAQRMIADYRGRMT